MADSAMFQKCVYETIDKRIACYYSTACNQAISYRMDSNFTLPIVLRYFGGLILVGGVCVCVCVCVILCARMYGWSIKGLGWILNRFSSVADKIFGEKVGAYTHRQRRELVSNIETTRNVKAAWHGLHARDNKRISPFVHVIHWTRY